MDPWHSQEGQPTAQQFITREQFEQIQQLHQQQIQTQQQQLEQQRHHIQQQQLEHEQILQQHQQQLRQSQQNQQNPSAFENALAIMAEGQKTLADNMNRLMIKLGDT